MGKRCKREVIDVEPWTDRGCIHTSSIVTYTPQYFEDLNKLCGKIEDALDDVGLGIDFVSKASEIEHFTDKRYTLSRYTTTLTGQLNEILDLPFGNKFRDAADNIAAIDMSEIQTDNTIGLQGRYTGLYSDKDNPIDIKLDYITLEDFIGNAGDEDRNDTQGNQIKRESVVNFKKIFKDIYNSCVKDGTINASKVSLEEFLDSLVISETPHTKGGSFIAELLERILQLTVIVPIIEAAMDKTLITGDNLTDSEGGMNAFMSALNLLLVGAGALSGNAIKAIGADLLAELSANSVMIAGEKQGMSKEQTLLLGFVVGVLTGTISYKTLGKTEKVRFIRNLRKLDHNNLKLAITNMDDRQVDEILKELGKSDDLAKRIKGIEKGGSGAVVSELDKAKIDKWKYRPTDEEYLKYKKIYDNTEYFNQTTGDYIYPGTENPVTHIVDKNTGGFVNGIREPDILEKGKVYTRYGDNGNAKYFSAEDVPLERRSLPPGTENKPLIKITVLKDIPCSSGEIAPWFDQQGGGIQYYMNQKIKALDGTMVDATLENLKKNRYIKVQIIQ